ncbi:DUF4426 domain-containing protein [Pseudomonas mangiferae]|uniref:DUF4426 domain-containing protein n=1 Tax=Pseudomonas mangiferae TaxID=2593654 RepID=A0A553GVX6_9PSED|nr:DUF4426 domain-containing protein [Pseudomonas mangiferae]TRX73593.1 DUF4426 domain-containing protein [Pseudomonas mangiferae]
MRRLALMLFTLCLALPAAAERMQRFGDLEVHYNAFNSGFLQPDTAAAAGLVRSKTLGVVNVTVLKDGKPAPAQVGGEIKDLLGKRTPLQFKEVRESGALYHLAQFPIGSREVLSFSLDIRGTDGEAHRIDFNQEIFPDE